MSLSGDGDATPLDGRASADVVEEALRVPPGTCVVVPAWREASVIGETVRGLLRTGATVVVVDDGSPDETGEAARRAGATVVRHPVNLGQGAALQTGITWAVRRSETRFVVTFDADGQHDPADLPALLAPLGDGRCDVTLGTRFHDRSVVRDMPRSRRLLLRLAVAFTRRSSGLSLTDTHNGLRAFTRDAARRIELTQNRMAHASELLAQIGRLGLRWREVPVTVRYTPYTLAKGQRAFGSLDILADLVGGRLR